MCKKRDKASRTPPNAPNTADPPPHNKRFILSRMKRFFVSTYHPAAGQVFIGKVRPKKGFFVR